MNKKTKKLGNRTGQEARQENTKQKTRNPKQETKNSVTENLSAVLKWYVNVLIVIGQIYKYSYGGDRHIHNSTSTV